MKNSHDKILIESAVQFLHEAEGMDDTAYETPASYKPIGIIPLEKDEEMMRHIYDHGEDSFFTMSKVLRNVAAKLGGMSDYYGTTEITLDSGEDLDDILLWADLNELLTYPETRKALEEPLHNHPSPDGSYVMNVRSIWFSGDEVALRGQLFFAPSAVPDAPTNADLRVPLSCLSTDSFPQIFHALKDTLMNRKRVSSSGHFGAAGDWMH